MSAFVALDFETADYGADSACALGAVRVEGTRLVESRYRLIRPPRQRIAFTFIHGIRWSDVADEPVFAEIWPVFADLFDDIDFIAAHNAGFDRKVLLACLDAASLPRPAAPFRCTVRLARDVLGIRPANLKNVCRRLGIPLQHHHALSDATACARIALAAAAAECGEAPTPPILASSRGRPDPDHIDTEAN
ncbi:MAG: exonuclease [Alphaproteobacteria bacterium]|nr:exonuclease [Alphaproteobacteria bacterium]